MKRIISIETKGLYKDDYQMKILKANSIKGLLPIRGQGVEESTRYDYDVSGKLPLKAMCERGAISREEFEQFLKQLPAVLKEVERHLLNMNCLLTDPDYVFYEEETFYFCYYPKGEEDIWERIGRLADFFVKHIDYKDNACVQMAFAFHEGVSEENYSLEKVVDACVKLGKEKGYEQWKEEKEKHREIFEYDTSEHDKIEEHYLTGAVMEATDNMWTPVKKFLNRHKKPKWGDFEGLYEEEE